MTSPLTPHERMVLRLLRHGDFTRDTQRARWRFGTRRIKDPAVDSLIARGLAMRFGDRVTLASPPLSDTRLPARAGEPAAATSSAPMPSAAAAGMFSTA